MTIRHDIRQWQTPHDFQAHLMKYDPGIASWAKGIVVHHTYKPTPATFQGRRTMEGLVNYYTTLGWPAGPHLFIATGCRNPEHDGIWQLTALNEKGVHAGLCNSWTWGIEVVGNYDTVPWSPVTEYYVLAVMDSLTRWGGINITADTIKGHRDCGSPKTCPGKAIDMSTVRKHLLAMRYKDG